MPLRAPWETDWDFLVGWEDDQDPGSPEREEEGSFSCPHCGAVVHWEGEPPSDCLRCGEDL